MKRREGGNRRLHSPAFSPPFCENRLFPRAVAAFGRSRRISRRQLDPGAFAQPVGTVHDHALAELEAGVHRNNLALRRPELDPAHRGRAVGHYHVNKCPGRASLDGSGRNDGRVALDVEEHAHVDELAREQRGILVCELRLQLHGAGRRVDLVVRRQQSPRGELDLVCAVVSVDGKLLAGLQFLHHRGQTVFGNREHHGDRLQLGDYDQSVASPARHCQRRPGANRDGPQSARSRARNQTATWRCRRGPDRA